MAIKISCREASVKLDEKSYPTHIDCLLHISIDIPISLISHCHHLASTINCYVEKVKLILILYIILRDETIESANV